MGSSHRVGSSSALLTGEMKPRRSIEQFRGRTWYGLKSGPAAAAASTIRKVHRRAAALYNGSSARLTCPESETWDEDLRAPRMKGDDCRRLRLQGCEERLRQR